MPSVLLGSQCVTFIRCLGSVSKERKGARAARVGAGGYKAAGLQSKGFGLNNETLA